VVTVPSKPTSVELRAYQVGFGDCFLLSFIYSANNKRHVLIDFGTTGLPQKTLKPSVHMKQVADDIKNVCNGQLTAIVATHRHRDHISGFATDNSNGGSGNIISACKPKVVLQPWTEDPKAAKNAKTATKDTNRSPKSFIASLNSMHRLAEHVWNVVRRPPPSMSVTAAKQLQFLGMDNIQNKSAVDNLIAMGQARGTKAVFARHGDNSGLQRLLPGVKVHVLGPPDLSQSEKIRKMRSSDPDEFWQLLGGQRGLKAMRVAPIEPGTRTKSDRSVPSEARWFRDHIASLSAEQLLEIVRVLDDQMNNTSLILLFEVGKKKLLFPGDAQIENWSYALQDAPNCDKTVELLKDVDVYKVGHHGSRNATPKSLWGNFSKRGSGRMQSVLSTMPGKHGTPAKKTEVPRKTLLDALKTETQLLNTDAFKADALYEAITVKV
jgi:beta-lactamase superfamily II metal-dependent hydrolase